MLVAIGVKRMAKALATFEKAKTALEIAANEIEDQSERLRLEIAALEVQRVALDCEKDRAFRVLNNFKTLLE